MRLQWVISFLLLQTSNEKNLIKDDEWFYGNATSEIGLMNRSFEDIYQENVVLSSPIDLNETDAQMNITEIL